MWEQRSFEEETLFGEKCGKGMNMAASYTGFLRSFFCFVFAVQEFQVHAVSVKCQKLDTDISSAPLYS